MARSFLSVRGASLTTGLFGAVGLLGLLFAGPGCSALPKELQAQQLEQRLKVEENCRLMGQKASSTTCQTVRQSLLGEASLSVGDQAALGCYDALHASNLTKAKKVFNAALGKEPRNIHLLACGKDLASFETAAK